MGGVCVGRARSGCCGIYITWTSVLLVLGGDGEGRIVGLDEL